MALHGIVGNPRENWYRITGELAKKWNNAKIQNWAGVLNQLSCLEETSTRIAKYIR